MFSVENVATPAAAAIVVVPKSEPPVGLLPIATETLPVKPVAVFPCASRAVTWTAAIVEPAGTDAGCVVKNRAAAAPGAMLNGPLVEPASPPAVADRV